MLDVNKWNEKIYKDEKGNFIEGPELGNEELWNEFGIESWPKFKTACASHIPVKWTDDVRLMLQTVKKELGDRITFQQIKEKWCWLTIYYGVKDEEARTRMRELIKECQDRLIAKDIHPTREENG